MSFYLKTLAMTLIVTILSSCQSIITLDDFDRLSMGMQATKIITPTHQHLVIHNVAQKSLNELHVYIEGDGTPWKSRYLIASDPSPRNPLALKLMQRDSAPSIYLARPCYFNQEKYGVADTNCNFTHWTNGRYSEEVVESMIFALRDLIKKQPSGKLVLIGHSGGGTLAMLMAQRMEEVDILITIAANLDIDAWTKHHKYSHLSRSINPAKLEQYRTFEQYHLAGEDDKVVPPELNEKFLQKIGSPLIVKKHFNHNCCWIEKWPDILAEILNQ